MVSPSTAASIAACMVGCWDGTRRLSARAEVAQVAVETNTTSTPALGWNTMVFPLTEWRSQLLATSPRSLAAAHAGVGAIPQRAGALSRKDRAMRSARSTLPSSPKWMASKYRVADTSRKTPEASSNAIPCSRSSAPSARRRG